jgi:hypothetical protein
MSRLFDLLDKIRRVPPGTDEKIAHALGMSRRNYRRRLKEALLLIEWAQAVARRKGNSALVDCLEEIRRECAK